MFNDLNNQPQNNISPQSVKAYPSINSPNNGNINQEENMRWIMKSIASKPFIFGSKSDIDEAFSGGSAGNGIYMGSAKCNIDGYNFRLAPQENLSFDSDQNPSFITYYTQYGRRFVQELVNNNSQDMSDKLSSKFDTFLLDEYNPENLGVTPSASAVNELKQKFVDAYNNHTVIGVVKIRYNNTYFSEIIQNLANVTLKYVNGNIQIPYTVNSSDIPTSSNIQTQITNIITQYLNNGENGIAYYNSADSYADIYYPVYYQGLNTENGVKISFTDIFGLVFYSSVSQFTSRLYPTTQSLFFDMVDTGKDVDNNTSPFYCLPTTTNYSSSTATDDLYIYDYSELYDENNKRKPLSSLTLTDGKLTKQKSPIYKFASGEHGSNGVFQHYDESGTSGAYSKNIGTKTTDLLNPLYVNNDDKFNIYTNLTYFCILLDPDLQGLQYRIPGSSTPVPIAFMTSNGVLCPYGMPTGVRNNVRTSSPVEGYVHFFKRAWLYTMKDNKTPTEQEIRNVSVDEMCGNGPFASEYGWFAKYLSAQISFWINFCYSALLENVVYGKSGNNFNFSGIGQFLNDTTNPSSSTITTTDFYKTLQSPVSYYSYEAPGYTVTSGSTSNAIREKLFQDDVTSDFDRFSMAINPNTLTPQNGYGQIGFGDTISTNTQKSYYVEDPLRYIRRCTSKDGTGGIKFNWFTFNKDYGDLESHIELQNIMLDDYFIPRPSSKTALPSAYNDDIVITLSSKTVTSIADPGHQVNSPIDGMCLSWKQYTWNCDVPVVASVTKDNLDYLMGVNIETGNYGGLQIYNKLNPDVLDSDLYIGNISYSTEINIGEYEIQTSNQVIETGKNSSYVKHRRESFIHFDKLYGENYESFEDAVKRITASQIAPEITVNLFNQTAKTVTTDWGAYYDSKTITISEPQTVLVCATAKYISGIGTGKVEVGIFLDDVQSTNDPIYSVVDTLPDGESSTSIYTSIQIPTLGVHTLTLNVRKIS